MKKIARGGEESRKKPNSVVSTDVRMSPAWTPGMCGKTRRKLRRPKGPKRSGELVEGKAKVVTIDKIDWSWIALTSF